MKAEVFCLALIALGLAVASCGKPPLSEFLKDQVIECDVTVTAPAVRPGETVSVKARFSNCVEVKL